MLFDRSMFERYPGMRMFTRPLTGFDLPHGFRERVLRSNGVLVELIGKGVRARYGIRGRKIDPVYWAIHDFDSGTRQATEMDDDGSYKELPADNYKGVLRDLRQEYDSRR
jgi:hypothetical protein